MRKKKKKPIQKIIDFEDINNPFLLKKIFENITLASQHFIGANSQTFHHGTFYKYSSIRYYTF